MPDKAACPTCSSQSKCRVPVIETLLLPDLCELQADALIVDLYMGSANEQAGFRWTMGGFWGAVTDAKNGIEGVAFNFTMIDQLAKGLHDAKVCPG